MKISKRKWLRVRRRIPLNLIIKCLHCKEENKKRHQVKNFSNNSQGVFLATYIIIGFIVFLVITS